MALEASLSVQGPTQTADQPYTTHLAGQAKRLSTTVLMPLVV